MDAGTSTWNRPGSHAPGDLLSQVFAAEGLVRHDQYPVHVRPPFEEDVVVRPGAVSVCPSAKARGAVGYPTRGCSSTPQMAATSS